MTLNRSLSYAISQSIYSLFKIIIGYPQLSLKKNYVDGKSIARNILWRLCRYIVILWAYEINHSVLYSRSHLGLKDHTKFPFKKPTDISTRRRTHGQMYNHCNGAQTRVHRQFSSTKIRFPVITRIDSKKGSTGLVFKVSRSNARSKKKRKKLSDVVASRFSAVCHDRSALSGLPITHGRKTTDNHWKWFPS